jgi:hypothetical protein
MTSERQDRAENPASENQTHSFNEDKQREFQGHTIVKVSSPVDSKVDEVFDAIKKAFPDSKATSPVMYSHERKVFWVYIALA